MGDIRSHFDRLCSLSCIGLSTCVCVGVTEARVGPDIQQQHDATQIS